MGCVWSLGKGGSVAVGEAQRKLKVPRLSATLAGRAVRGATGGRQDDWREKIGWMDEAARPSLGRGEAMTASRLENSYFLNPMKTLAASGYACFCALFIGMSPAVRAEDPPATPEKAAVATVDEKDASENRAKAKVAWNTDRKTLSAEQFAEMEKEYQEINQNFKAPNVKDLLTKFIEKWKKGNRVGCATLYLAQKTGGPGREELLKKCVGEFSDCYYLNGAQVGGMGRLYLAMYYKQAGKADDAKKLAAELKKDFANAQNHSRQKVVALLGDLDK